MSIEFNIYCDESCHLENDHQVSMVLGAVWCPKNTVKSISLKISEIRTKHHIPLNMEIKWGKVSPSKLGFYLDLIEYFFKETDLHFRCLVVPDKSILKHEKFSQDHDTWYYKMYFNMLKQIFDPKNEYQIYVDVKDTLGSKKIAKLHEVLCNDIYDFDRKIIKKIQLVRSHEVAILQIADLLIGAISFTNRNLDEGAQSSSAKKAILKRVRELSGHKLRQSTLLKEDKFNVFIWHPRECL